MPERFESVLYGVGKNLRTTLQKLSVTVKQNTDEIRIRKGLPLAITVSGETVFVKQNGQTCFVAESDLIIATKSDVEETFRLLCNNSVFAHDNELKKGYIKLRDGSRAGVFGVITENNIQEVSSINIRIAREIHGISYNLARDYKGEGWLIAGKPGSGKTTVLRDFIRQISSGITGKIYRVAVIDTRGELSGGNTNDLGLAPDILNIADKAKGLEIAVRTMFPEVVAFDEIGTTEELRKVKESFNAGVSVITTAHIGDVTELMKRNVTRELLCSGVIEKIALLPRLHGGDIKVYSVGELLNATI